MFRKAVIVLGSLGLTCMWAGALAAQEWPFYPRDQVLTRGPGDYLAWYKLLACAILVFFWVRTTDWINRDTFEVGDRIEMSGQIWNPDRRVFVPGLFSAGGIDSVVSRGLCAAVDFLGGSAGDLHLDAQWPRD